MLSALSTILLSTLRMGTPLALTALGGTMSEKSGVTNIGLEGIMTAAAFSAVVGSYYTGNPWIGVLAAVIVGILISAIHSFVCITAGGLQNISAMALVMLADGFSAVGINVVFHTSGNSAQVNSLSSTPVLAGIPVIGNFLSKLSPFVYLAFIMLAIVWYILKYTPLGLRINMVGEQPKAAETAGISVAIFFGDGQRFFRWTGWSVLINRTDGSVSDGNGVWQRLFSFGSCHHGKMESGGRFLCGNVLRFI